MPIWQTPNIFEIRTLKDRSMSKLARSVAFALLALGIIAAPRNAISQSIEARSPVFGRWGFDIAGADFAVRPGDDFFRYANGALV